jgi:hypothetical protein
MLHIVHFVNRLAMSFVFANNSDGSVFRGVNSSTKVLPEPNRKK